MSDPPISSRMVSANAKRFSVSDYSGYSRDNVVKAVILCILLGVFYAFVVLLECGSITTLPSRLFRLDDTSLMRPYHHDTASELSVALTIFLLGPAYLVAGVMAGHIFNHSAHKPSLPGGFPVLLWAYINSFAIVFFVADICQYSVGALRPGVYKQMGF